MGVGQNYGPLRGLYYSVYSFRPKVAYNFHQPPYTLGYYRGFGGFDVGT